jgi:ribosomal protein S18 acetylase RimI-like enzyme
MGSFISLNAMHTTSSLKDRYMDIDYQTFESGDFSCLLVLSNGCADSIGYIADHIPRKDSVLVVASHMNVEAQEKEVAGYVMATANEQGVYIHNVHVLENFQRKGIATKMLMEIEKLIWNGKAAFPITLFTDEENEAAMKCYAGAGFSVALRIPNCRNSGEARIALRKDSSVGYHLAS